jgi:hypothetical protein
MRGDPLNTEFLEQLPDGCPPTDALPPEPCDVIRLAKGSTPTHADFASHAARGLPLRGPMTCSYASCSLFYHDAGAEQLNAMRRLPRFKNFKYAYIVRVDQGSGVGIAGGGKHLDLWMFKAFDPVAAVKSVERFHG